MAGKPQPRSKRKASRGWGGLGLGVGGWGGGGMAATASCGCASLFFGMCFFRTLSCSVVLFSCFSGPLQKTKYMLLASGKNGGHWTYILMSIKSPVSQTIPRQHVSICRDPPPAQYDDSRFPVNTFQTKGDTPTWGVFFGPGIEKETKGKETHRTLQRHPKVLFVPSKKIDTDTNGCPFPRVSQPYSLRSLGVKGLHI